MGTTHNFTAAELDTNDVEELFYRLWADYTPSNIPTWDEGTNTYDLTVDENSIVKATMLTNVNAATPASLSLDSDDVSVIGDGVATGSIVVTDSRGAAANGKVVKIRIEHGGLIKLTGLPLTLAGVGQATLTIGESARANECSSDYILGFYYADGSAKPTQATVRYTE